MGNFKVKVNNAAESREAQELFLGLGLKRRSWSEHSEPPLYICNWIEGEFSNYSLGDRGLDFVKELTLPELRAMVKPMKEYLQKRPDGTYVHKTGHGEAPEEWIEIPDGATHYATDSNLGIKKNYFFRCPDDAIWVESQWMRASFSVSGQTVLWKRESEAESLVDWSNVINNAQQIFDHENAGKPSLNDQYAEIEKVRQHRHYFIDVSDVDEIDFYEIALRYNVTDPCIQHILKKCLAAGQRGQKDFHHDLKDIYDTAKRMLAVHGLDS